MWMYLAVFFSALVVDLVPVIAPPAWTLNRVAHDVYEAMMNAIRNDETPNFYFMHYDLATWRVKNS